MEIQFDDGVQICQLAVSSTAKRRELGGARNMSCQMGRWERLKLACAVSTEHLAL